MSSLVSSLCWCSLQITLLALIALLLGSRPWRLGGTMLPLLGLIGIGLITVMAFVPMPWSWNLSSLARQVELDANSAVAGAETASQAKDFSVQATTKLAYQQGSDDRSAFWGGLIDGLNANTTPKESNWIWEQLSKLVLGVFITGFAIGAFRIFVGLLGTRRIIQRCTPIVDEEISSLVAELSARLKLNRKIVLLETDCLSTAATVGSWRPRILLPIHWREWSDAELDAVLAHELAHIIHGDFAAVIISQLSLAIHFYHPLVHWLAGRLRLEQELAADTVAAQAIGGEKNYAKILAKLALEQQDRFVGWPARAFLPTRQTFLRRLEMLRDGNGGETKRIFGKRWFATIAIGTAFLVLVSFRPQENQAVAQAPGDKPSTTGGVFDLSHFTENGGLVLAVRPAEMLANKQLAGIVNQLTQPTGAGVVVDTMFGLQISEIEQAIVSFQQKPFFPSSAYIRTSKPIEKLDFPAETRTTRLAGAEVFELDGERCVWRPDNRTIVLGNKRDIARTIEGRPTGRKLVESAVWKTLSNQPIVAVVDASFIRGFSRPDDPLARIINPIVDETEVFGLALTVKGDLAVSAVAQSVDAKGATIIQETGKALVTLASNGLRDIPTPSNDNLLQLSSVGSKILQAVQWKIEGTNVSATSSIQFDESLGALLANFVVAARKGSQRQLSANNLKQLGLALHNFESAYRHLPATTRSQNPEHKHPVSWRVMILPFIEQGELFQQYRFDEPWDGPNNSKLLAKMPAVFRNPDDPKDSTLTSYVAISGDETIFRPDSPTSFREVSDGLSNTVMVVEAKTSIPWMKPEDVIYLRDKPLPSTGGIFEQGFHALFGDGSVRFLSESIDESLLRAMYTARGGEVLGRPASN
jgi:beta-lactamase regulating signal transducer with metallopeptidase domain